MPCTCAHSLVAWWVDILLCFHSPEDLRAMSGTAVPAGDTSAGSSRNSTSTVLAGESLVGEHVERLNVEVVDGVAVYVAGAQYSVHTEAQGALRQEPLLAGGGLQQEGQLCPHSLPLQGPTWARAWWPHAHDRQIQEGRIHQTRRGVSPSERRDGISEKNGTTGDLAGGKRQATKGVGPLHGEPTAHLFPDPEHRILWETKRALTLSVDDEFPGTLQTIVASRDGDFPGTRAAQLASKRHSATRGGGSPTPPPQPPPSLPPVVPTPMSVDEAPSLSEGPPLPGPSVNTPSLASVVVPPAPTKHRTQTRQLATAVLACLVLVELWAGVASLSTSCLDAGHSLFAFCEANPLLHSLLSLIHPDSLTALKSEAGEWRDWVMPTTGVTWLAGLSCVGIAQKLSLISTI